jgi:PTS system glucitol/sorbitol-specific IIA component
MIIIFDDSAPEELAEICLLHEHQPLLRPVRAGDRVSIDDQVYLVTAVGDVANKTLEELGHVTLLFDGAREPQKPGCIHLGACPPSYAVGSRLRFWARADEESNTEEVNHESE